MKLILIVLAMLNLFPTTTVKREKRDTVSKIPATSWFDNYRGIVVVRSKKFEGSTIHATSAACGAEYYYAVAQTATQLHRTVVQPPVINIDQWDRAGIPNCVFAYLETEPDQKLKIDLLGPKPSVNHLELFVSRDEDHLAKVIDLAPSATEIDLKPFGLPKSMTLYFYLKVVGQPLYVNHFVGPTMYSTSFEQGGN